MITVAGEVEDPTGEKATFHCVKIRGCGRTSSVSPCELFSSDLVSASTV